VEIGSDLFSTINYSVGGMMKRKIIMLICLDAILLVLSFLWLYGQYGVYYYGVLGTVILVLSGPFFMFKEYGTSIFGFLLKLDHLFIAVLFTVLCYGLLLHSHKKFFDNRSIKQCCCIVVPYIVLSWLIYDFITAFFIYFSSYCR
jgi:hypothetical protein